MINSEYNNNFKNVIRRDIEVKTESLLFHSIELLFHDIIISI